MKKIFFWLVVVVSLSHCKEKFKEPLPTFNNIAGRWHLIEKETVVNGQKVWEKATDNLPYSFAINADGTILDSSGLPMCCGPESFVLNGHTIKINNLSQMTSNPACALVNCAPCNSWGLQQVGNELIIDYCGYERAKYIRE